MPLWFAQVAPVDPSVNLPQLGIAGVTVAILLVIIGYLWQHQRRTDQEHREDRQRDFDTILQLADKANEALHQQGGSNRELTRAVSELRDQVQLLRGEESGRARR